MSNANIAIRFSVAQRAILQRHFGSAPFTISIYAAHAVVWCNMLTYLSIYNTSQGILVIPEASSCVYLHANLSAAVRQAHSIFQGNGTVLS
jgi:hypothetical protein